MARKSVAAAERRKAVESVPLDAAKYRAILAGAELADVKMTALTFKTDTSYYAAQTSNDPANPFHREISFGPGDLVYDGKEGMVVGFFNASLTMELRKKKVFSLSAEYVVAYKLAEEARHEAEAKAYVAQVGKLAAYPYFRQTASSVANMAGADLPVLPVMRESIFVKGGKP